MCSPFGGTTNRFAAVPTTGPTMSAATPTRRPIASTGGLIPPMRVIPSARQITTIGKRKSRKRCPTGYKPREPATKTAAAVVAKTKTTGGRRLQRQMMPTSDTVAASPTVVRGNSPGSLKIVYRFLTLSRGVAPMPRTVSWRSPRSRIATR